MLEMRIVRFPEKEILIRIQWNNVCQLLQKGSVEKQVGFIHILNFSK